eukprot:7141001-Pyramimonas_sp.AAC.1
MLEPFPLRGPDRALLASGPRPSAARQQGAIRHVSSARGVGGGRCDTARGWRRRLGLEEGLRNPIMP